MSRMKPLKFADLSPDVQSMVTRAEEQMGFVANDVLIMARNPAMMNGLSALVGAVYAPGTVDDSLKRLIGLVTSSAAGCQYCMGHTAFSSERFGVDQEKIAAVWEFETHAAFTESERVALRVALHAGQTPNGVTDEMFAMLAQHYDETAQLEIVAVIAMFGFLNRWNATLATELESLPGAALRRAQ